MKLSIRLEKILEFISEARGEKDETLLDVGTDHGFVPIEAVSRGFVKNAIASDVVPGPVERADEHIKEAGLSEKISTRITDGLNGYAPLDADIISITGMGGKLMIKILSEGYDVAQSAKHLILSPQSDLVLFRGWLQGNNFLIVKESIVADGGKYYFIIDAVPREMAGAVSFDDDYSDFELEFGKKNLFAKKDLAARRDYINRELANSKNIYYSLSGNASDAAVKRRGELEARIENIEGGEKLGEGRKKFWKGFLVGALVIALLTGGILGGGYAYYNSTKNASIRQLDEAEEKLIEIKNLVDNSFIFDYEHEAMINSMLSGYVAGLSDVYSEYYTAEQIKNLSSQIEGKFSGVGCAIAKNTETGDAVIMAVYKDLPAYKAGIKEGDIVVAVDGEDVTKLALDAVTSRVRGAAGTDVTITVMRGGEKLDFTITRQDLEIPVIAYKMLDGGVGYIQFSEFKDVSVEQMKTAITDLESQGAKGLIVDIRNNPGGTLDSVIPISNMFLDEGYTIATRKGKNGDDIVHKTTNEKICDLPLVVLVNGNSASASELFTGAMKDNSRATIVGTKTFGKGIVQQFFQFSDGSAIKLTTQHYYTPSGECIHGVGITPDVEVEASDSNEDVQLNTAVEVLKQKY